MSNREVTIKGRNNTNVAVTGQEELLVKDNSLDSIKTPHLISVSTTGTIPGRPHSVSIYNAGNAVGTLTVNGNPAVSIPVGATINMDAGGNNNKFITGAFDYDATDTTFIIAYVA
jgi:hypothetical protein